MVKIGILVMNGGMWEGRSIVSYDWIKASTTPHIATGEFLGEYGYLWWIGSFPTSTGSERVILADGWGSQFIALFPDRDMVLVTTGANEYNGKHFALAPLLGQYLFGNSQE
jgi:CubicO group peptidase (beta-lactamase class C family)